MANQHFAGPQVTPTDMGAITGANSAQSNPFLAISQALAQLPEQQKLKKQADEDRQYQLQQRQFQTQQQQVQTQQLEQDQAQNQLKLVSGQLLADPTKATDPQHVKLVTDLYSKLGLPAPIKPDGSIDINEFKTSWDSVDEKTKEYILSMPPEQRKARLDEYSGVSKDLYTTQAFISAKDQAALSRAYTAKTSEQDRTDIQTKRLALQSDVDKAREAGDYARVGYLQTKGIEAAAETARIALQTSQMPQQLKNATNRVNGYLQHLQQVGQNRTGQFAVVRQLQASAKDINEVYNKASDSFDKLNASYNTALSNNADPESPQMQAIQQQINQAQADMDNARQARDQANAYLLGAGQSLPTAGYVAGSGGGNVVNVETPGQAKPVGDASGVADGTTANGGKYVARGGKWYAK